MISPTPRLNVAIVGSRDFPSQYVVESMIYELPAHHRIVSGGARGPDTWAEQTAKHHKRETLIFSADWNKFGKRAGFVRNNQIIKAADLVIAFHYNNSPGTKHSISLAKYLN